MQVVCSVNRVHATNRVGFLKTKNSRASVAVKSNMAFQSWDFDSDDEATIGTIRGAYMSKSRDDDMSAQGPLAWMAELLSPPGMEQNTASNKNYGSWDYDETTQGKSQSNNDERMARDF